jgi:soluble lytic murein transglycosylase-like protein
LKRRFAAGALVALVAARALAAESRGEELFAVVEGDRVVYTNTPGRGRVRTLRAQADPADSAGTPRPRPALPATAYDRDIEEVARQHGLSPSLIKAVALVESGLDPRAVSPKGALGLMQLMPATARQYGVGDAFDPVENLRAGAAHLRSLLDEFGGDLGLALAAYNAGSGAVRRHGGIPAYAETRSYVEKVHERLGREPRRRPAVRAAGAVKLVIGTDGSVALVN